MTPAVIDHIMERLVGYELSPSDLTTFLESPLIFLTRAVFRYPFEPTPHTIFGQVYHRALEDGYREWQKTRLKPPVELLLRSLERSLYVHPLEPVYLRDALEK